MARLCKSLLLLVPAFLLAMLPTSSFGQQNHPDKEKLFRAIKERRLLKRDLPIVVKAMREQGVSYELSETDEQELRRLGKHLGKKGLNNLVVAIRSNYRADVSRKPVSQEPHQQESAPEVISLRHYVTYKSSDSTEFPYAMSVVIQTNIPFSPTHVQVYCDGPIGSAFASAAVAAGSVGTIMKSNPRYGYSPDRTVYEFYWSSPAFTPDVPLEVTVRSATKLRVLKVVPIIH